MDLIKQINNGLRKKVNEGQDPLKTEDIRDLDGVASVLGEMDASGKVENEEQFDPTGLTDDQVVRLARWVYDKIEDDGLDPNKPHIVGDVALDALDNIAGFETAADEVIKKTINRIETAFHKLVK